MAAPTADVLTLCFGSGPALACAADTLEYAYKSLSPDALLTSSKVARAVVFSSDLPQSYSTRNSESGVLQDEALEVWSEGLKTVNREHISRRLQGPWWHRERSWCRTDKEAFVDNVRWMVEKSDTYGGAHIFVDGASARDSIELLRVIRDDVIGTPLSRSTLMFNMHDSLVSPEAALHLANVGTDVLCQVPLWSASSDKNVQSIIGATINLLTMPHRQSQLSLIANVEPVIFGSTSINLARLSSAPSSKEISIASQWGDALFGCMRVMTESKPPIDRVCLGRYVERLVSPSSAMRVTETALELSEACPKYLSLLAPVLSSASALQYCRLVGVEDDERVEARNVLLTSADSITGFFDS